MLPWSGKSFVSLYRATACVLDAATAAASMAVSRQPVRASLFRVKVSGGTTGSGTVVLAGTLSGTAKSETFTFAANGVQRGKVRMDTLSTITTTGLADEATKATVEVQAVDEQGAPQPTTYALVTGRRADISYKGSGDWPSPRQGSTEADEATISLGYEEAWPPRVGDQVSEDATGERWLVRSTRILPSSQQPQFWEMRCTRLTT